MPPWVFYLMAMVFDGVTCVLSTFFLVRSASGISRSVGFLLLTMGGRRAFTPVCSGCLCCSRCVLWTSGHQRLNAHPVIPFTSLFYDGLAYMVTLTGPFTLPFVCFNSTPLRVLVFASGQHVELDLVLEKCREKRTGKRSFTPLFSANCPDITFTT
jgi:hypothetical protein